VGPALPEKVLMEELGKDAVYSESMAIRCQPILEPGYGPWLVCLVEEAKLRVFGEDVLYQPRVVLSTR
jgi:hypothetical protein